VKFEGDRSNSLEVTISQTQESGKAIRPLLADLVLILSSIEIGWLPAIVTRTVGVVRVNFSNCYC